MKRFLVAFFLIAAASLAYATDDATTIFKRLWAADQLHRGLNLILTYPNGQKLWADAKAENGYATINFVVTDGAGRRIPTVILDRSGRPRLAAVSEVDTCRICDPNGKNCHDGPCPIHVPCCPNHHWCCIK